MGYLLLIAGLALFAYAHLFKRLKPEARAAMGDAKGRGLLSLAMVAGVVLMVVGYRAAPVITIWSPPDFLTHLNSLLMIIAFWLFAQSFIAGKLATKIRHKQLSAVKAWAIAHLLVNGDLASVLLFGGMLAWAVASVIVINRASRAWDAPANASIAKDGLALGAGLVAMLATGYVHNLLGYWPYG